MSVSQEVPAFFDEGLAELFSTARFAKGIVRFEPREDYLRMLRSRRWISFERLVEVKRHDPEYVDHGLAPAFYAQAWATMYYALAVDPGIHSRLRAYLRALENGDSLLDAVEALLGCSAAEANPQIAAFIRRRNLPHIEVAVVESSEAGLAPIRRLESTESTLALSELLMRMGGHGKQARDLLRQIPEESRHEAHASVLKAWLHLQDGRPDDATQLLDAVHERTLDGPTRVALARGLFEVAAAGKSSGMSPDQRTRLRRAEALFEAALDDRTTRLEAINGYVLTRLALDEHDESLITLAEIAYQSAPRSSELAVALAILHDLAGRRQVARNYWKSAARNTQMEPMRSRILDRLNSDSLPKPGSAPR
jgi:tetratricopeptide (TPR) repeat protein